MTEENLIKNKQEKISSNEIRETQVSQNEQPVELVAETACTEINNETTQFKQSALEEVEHANDSIGLDEHDVETVKSEVGIDDQVATINTEAETLNTSSQVEIRQIVSEDDMSTESSSEIVIQREQIKKLRARLDYLKSKLEISDADFETCSRDYDVLRDERAEHASTIASNITESLVHPQDAETIKQEIADIENLLNSDAVLEQIGKQLDQHYSANQDQSPEQQEKLKQTVEQTAIRNNIFFVHTINESEQLRHNANSNVSSEATFEDDLDILLSLEPSISASTVAPGADEKGRVSGLWSHSGGVIIGKGQIKEAHYDDAGTISHGIKNRKSSEGYEVATQKIDEYAVNRRTTLSEDVISGSKSTERGGYNEYVIDNPKIFGYYMHAEQDSDGEFWAYDLGVKQQEKSGYYEEREMFKNNIDKYSSKIAAIENKGVPVYIMTPDRKIYEYKGMNNGRITVGSELKPEDVANGNSGKSINERKIIGKNLLKKEIFKDDETKKEAGEILFTPNEIEKQKQDQEVIDEILKARFKQFGFVQEVLQSTPAQMQTIFEKYGIKNAESQKVLSNPKLLDELRDLWGTENEKDKYDEVLDKYLQAQ